MTNHQCDLPEPICRNLHHIERGDYIKGGSGERPKLGDFQKPIYIAGAIVLALALIIDWILDRM